MHTFLSNLANRQTDRQTDKRTRQTHLPPRLSEVKILSADLIHPDGKEGESRLPTSHPVVASAVGHLSAPSDSDNSDY